MRIVFMGTPDIAATCLTKILEDGFEVVGVYPQPDRPKGRGMKMVFSPVKEVAIAHNIPVFQPETFREDAVVEEFAALKPDVCAVVRQPRHQGAPVERAAQGLPVQVKDARVAAVAAQGVQGTSTGGGCHPETHRSRSGGRSWGGAPSQEASPGQPHSLVLSGRQMWSRRSSRLRSPHDGGQILVWLMKP